MKTQHTLDPPLVNNESREHSAKIDVETFPGKKIILVWCFFFNSKEEIYESMGETFPENAHHDVII